MICVSNTIFDPFDLFAQHFQGEPPLLCCGSAKNPLPARNWNILLKKSHAPSTRDEQPLPGQRVPLCPKA
jgi:hypothetical protein